jgi:predicted MPP superfamily phosphohydrolase
MTWLATMFLLAVALLGVDLATGFGLLAPRIAPRLRGWGVVAGAVMVVVAVVQGLRAPVVVRDEVTLAELPPGLDGTVVVAVADTHLGSLLGAEWLAARVRQIEAERADIIVLLGDLFEGHGAPDPKAVALLRGLSAPLGVWAVTGNHESHGRGADGSGVLDRSGLSVLHDRWVEVRPGLIVAGLDTLTGRDRGRTHPEIVTNALAGRPAGAVILLSHVPWLAETAARAGVGLMLCGHTHGGQIWPFGLLEHGMFPLLAGRYEVGGMPVIVSRGTGTWGPRMRLWQPGEILRITLRSAPPRGKLGERSQ